MMEMLMNVQEENMKLTKKQNALIDVAEQLLIDKELRDEVDYEFGTIIDRDQGYKKTKIKVTFPYDKKIVDVLKKKGWEVEKKYENNGSPSIFASDIHNDQFELDLLMTSDSEKIKMVRMIFEISVEYGV